MNVSLVETPSTWWAESVGCPAWAGSWCTTGWGWRRLAILGRRSSRNSGTTSWSPCSCVARRPPPFRIRDHWETHVLGLICPGTTFFAGSLPGWWDFTAELKQHNFNTKVGLHALALVWKGGQLWKCLSGESIPSNCFLCVLTNYKIVHTGWQNLLCHS